jgi:hypothetical protein
MKNTIVGISLIACGAFMCVRREWVADKLQRFYSNYPLVRLAGPNQIRSRGGFVAFLGILFAGIGMAAIAEQWFV